MLNKTSKLWQRITGGANTPQPTPSATIGAWGEDQAATYLTDQGYTIVGRNVRPTKHDEIDLIARKDNILVFVEVKTRSSEGMVRPARAVDTRKRHALNRAAAAYLRQVRYPDLYYRFDVIEVIGTPAAATPRIEHLDNAFPFEKRFHFPIQKP